ncbi:hypothetical protein MBLNU230_g2776t1 [Neophaeotheca triangularis]
MPGMRSLVATSLLFLRLALAAPNPNPLPQAIDFDLIDSVPDPTALGPEPDETIDVVPYDRKSALAAASAQVLATAVPDVPAGKVKRIVVADAPSCELAESDKAAYSADAQGAVAPQGYRESFRDLQASVESIGYMGLRTLTAYDPNLCAVHCKSGEGCVAFTIFHEDNTCSNPPSQQTKCTLYGFPVSASSATNKGQGSIKIAGSNGYTRDPISPSITKYQPPTPLTCAINAPLDPVTGKNTFVGSTAFKTNQDPAQCAAVCNTHNQFHASRPNPTDGTYPACNFFNSYILYKNGAAESLVCSMYSRVWDNSFTKNCGQFRGKDQYTIGQSAGYALAEPLPGGCKAPQTWNGKACVAPPPPPSPPTGENAACVGATCGSTRCNSDPSNCFCVETTEGVGRCLRSGAAPCGRGCALSSECSSDEICVHNTCCGYSNCVKNTGPQCGNPQRVFSRVAKDLSSRQEGRDSNFGAWDEEVGAIVPGKMAEE